MRKSTYAVAVPFVDLQGKSFFLHADKMLMWLFLNIPCFIALLYPVTSLLHMIWCRCADDFPLAGMLPLSCPLVVFGDHRIIAAPYKSRSNSV